MSDTELFFAIKGIISVLSVVLLIFHMSTSPQVIRRAQRMRYISLLGFAVVVTGKSAKQVSDNSSIQIDNAAVFIVSVFLLLTAIVSIRDERTHR
jgi:hypothetical protein